MIHDNKKYALKPPTKVVGGNQNCVVENNVMKSDENVHKGSGANARQESVANYKEAEKGAVGTDPTENNIREEKRKEDVQEESLNRVEQQYQWQKVHRRQPHWIYWHKLPFMQCRKKELTQELSLIKLYLSINFGVQLGRFGVHPERFGVHPGEFGVQQMPAIPKWEDSREKKRKGPLSSVETV